MTTEFLRVEKFHQGGGLRKRMEVQPELSLGPTWSPARSSSSESDGSSRKKRKHYNWEEAPVSHGSLDLQLKDPLPLDWEQCLDLQVSLFAVCTHKFLASTVADLVLNFWSMSMTVMNQGL
jgi:hypothetical protein